MIEGYGVHYWSDGSVYRGMWKNFQMNGDGEFQWPDGRTFKGEYYMGRKHGYGVFKWPDGKICKGTWKNGDRQSIELHEQDANIPEENKGRLTLKNNSMNQNSFNN